MVTLKDIAAAAGVSPATVSKVLTRSRELGRIHPSTARKVRRLASQLGYRPNLQARALVRNRSMTIGVYCAPHPGKRINSTYVGPILEGVCQAAGKAHYDVMLIDFGIGEGGLESCRERFLTKRVDGVVLVNAYGDEEIVETLLACDRPVVAINNFAELPVTSVDLDCKAGMALAVEHLYSLGHRHIAFLGELTPETFPDHWQRGEAFRDIVRALDIEDTSLLVRHPVTEKVVPRTGDFCFQDGYQGVDWLLKRGRRFTALVCYNDLVAGGAMNRLQEAGIKVPAEVSVIGFDDSDMARYLMPPLTSVAHPIRDMGAQAVEIILKALQGGKGKLARRRHMVHPRLVERRSCAPPRKL